FDDPGAHGNARSVSKLLCNFIDLIQSPTIATYCNSRKRWKGFSLTTDLKLWTKNKPRMTAH
ncbi:hypothetical protein ILYODFUR_000585, partial [Ilyodon furcidens]